MSLTSYRTAPPRGTYLFASSAGAGDEKAAARFAPAAAFEIVNGFIRSPSKWYFDGARP